MLHPLPQALVEKIIESGFSQADIAKETGISQPTISRILSGTHKDPRSSVMDLLRSFYARHVQGTAKPAVENTSSPHPPAGCRSNDRRRRVCEPPATKKQSS